MKNLIIITTIAMLSGCWQSVSSYDINKAVEKCGSIENVHELTAYFLGKESFTCFKDISK